MRYLLLMGLLACVSLTGCESPGGKRPTKGEVFVMKVNVNGIHIGATKKAFLAKFPQARQQPFGRTDREVYEVAYPNPHISLAVAYFVNDQLMKLELRYFDGPGVATLTGAGGWDGLKNYIIGKFGPPTRVGTGIVLETEFGDLKPQYAKFSGEWSFPSRNREVQYIVFSDARGGMGIVTFLDTTPSPAVIVPAPAPVAEGKIRTAPVRIVPAGPPNPGF